MIFSIANFGVERKIDQLDFSYSYQNLQISFIKTDFMRNFKYFQQDKRIYLEYANTWEFNIVGCLRIQSSIRSSIYEIIEPFPI